MSTADRERTKRIVYASLYGAGARKLMDILDASYEQTLAITASFNSQLFTFYSRIQEPRLAFFICVGNLRDRRLDDYSEACPRRQSRSS